MNPSNVNFEFESSILNNCYFSLSSTSLVESECGISKLSRSDAKTISCSSIYESVKIGIFFSFYLKPFQHQYILNEKLKS